MGAILRRLRGDLGHLEAFECTGIDFSGLYSKILDLPRAWPIPGDLLTRAQC